MIAVDTNILIYAFDSSEPKKRKICKSLVESIFEGKQRGVLTNQVLAEFAYVATRKMRRPMKKTDAQAIVATLLASPHWIVHNYTGNTVQAALQLDMPLWDALLAQTLKEHGVNTFVTENIKDFATSGLLVRNPLKA